MAMRITCSILGYFLALAGALASPCNQGLVNPIMPVFTATSGNVANASAVATLAAPGAGLRWNIVGFEIVALGATAALGVAATLSGLDGGAGAAVTGSYSFAFPAGATVAATSVIVNYGGAGGCPITALPNTAVTLTLPAGGSGNTNAAVNIHGFLSQ